MSGESSTTGRRLGLLSGIAPLLVLQAALAQNAEQPAKPQVQGRIQIQVGPAQTNIQGWVFDQQTQQWVQQAAIPPPLPTAEALASVKVDPQIAELVAGLNAPGYEQREQAMMKLLAAPCEIEQLYAMLAGKNLSLEQRYRLLEVVRGRLVDAPRGAMGVRMRWQQMQFDQPGAVQIEDLIDGLPAKGLLRRGDRITQVDGRPLLAQQDLLETVQNKRPGDMVRLTVERPRVNETGDPVMDAVNKPVIDTVPIDMQLGSADQLPKDDPSAMFGPNVVVQRRQMQARALEQQFAPHVKRMAVPSRGGIEEESASDADVDDYPPVQRLLSDRAALTSGRMQDSPQIRAMWKQQLDQLAQAAQAPGIDAAQREFLTRVYRRYAELIMLP